MYVLFVNKKKTQKCKNKYKVDRFYFQIFLNKNKGERGNFFLVGNGNPIRFYQNSKKRKLS